MTAARPSAQPTTHPSGPAPELGVEELVVEEVSIDGMCGVY